MNPVIADLAARRDWADHDEGGEDRHLLVWTALQLLAAEADLRDAPRETRARAHAVMATAKALPARAVTQSLVLAVCALTSRAQLRSHVLNFDAILTLAEAAVATVHAPSERVM